MSFVDQRLCFTNKSELRKGAGAMRRAILASLVLFFFSTMALTADRDRKDGDRNEWDHKKAVVGVWTMGFCQAQSPPYPLPFSCTTQVVNFHEDGSVWSSYMFDQNPFSKYGGPSVGATGNWHYLGDNQFYVTMLRFVNDPSNGYVKSLLRTDFTVEAFPRADEAVTGKMRFLFYLAEPAPPLTYPVVKRDPYRDPPNEVAPGPTGIPMKRVPSFDPNSPVFP
jgi:hypothetical protein